MQGSSFEVHSLLTPPRPSYSALTLRRACVVAAHCGMHRQFTTVCNYYHNLEALEETYTPKHRAISRHCEFELFDNRPPSSFFQLEHFPHLYPTVTDSETDTFIQQMESISNDRCLFVLEGFNEIRYQKGFSLKKVLKTSDLIRQFCQNHMMTLRKFLEQFKSYVKICRLEETIITLMVYIQVKRVKDELLLAQNLKTFCFEDDFEIDVVKKENGKQMNSIKNKSTDISNSSLEDNFSEKNNSFYSSSPKQNFRTTLNVLGEIQNLQTKTKETSYGKGSKTKPHRNVKIHRKNILGEIENVNGELENGKRELVLNKDDPNSSNDLTVLNDSFKSCNLDVSFRNDFYSDDSNSHFDVRQLSTDFYDLACK